MSCSALTKCIVTSACPSNAGVDGVVYIGLTKNIDTNTTTFDADGSVNTLALVSGTNLKKFSTRRYKNTARHELTKGENGQTFFNHFVELKFNIETQAHIAALEELAKAEDLFVIIKLNSGVFKVFGISSLSPKGFGLSSSEGGQNEGVNLGDDNMDRLVLSGMLPNKPMLFNPSATLAANTSAIEALVSCT